MTLQTVTALQAATFVIVISTGIVEVWQVYVLAALFGLLNASEMPTRVSFVAELVPDEDLPNAVALMLVAMNASRVIGPALAGILAVLFGYGANFTWSLAAALLAVLLVGLISPKRTRLAPRQRVESIFTSVANAVGTCVPIRSS